MAYEQRVSLFDEAYNSCLQQPFIGGSARPQWFTSQVVK